MKNNRTVTIGSETQKQRHLQIKVHVHNQYTKYKGRMSYITITMTYFYNKVVLM